MFIMYSVILSIVTILLCFFILSLFVYRFNQDSNYKDKLEKHDENDPIKWKERYFLIQSLIINKEYKKLLDLCESNILEKIKLLKENKFIFIVIDHRMIKDNNKYIFKITGRNKYENIVDEWIFEKKDGKILLVSIS